MKNISVAIIAVIIAVLSFWAGGHYRGKRPGDLAAEGPRTVLYYSDPMNPGFRTDQPGIAPCGMPLEPVYADTGEGTAGSPASLSHGAVKIGPERQQLIGVQVAVVEMQPMTYTLRLYGKVVPDETRVYRVNASTDSWIRELSDVTTGSIVKKDQLLAEALAPAYYNAQVTYLIAMDNVDRIKQQLGGQLRHQQGDLANNQIRMAVQALQNLGIGDAQVEELANTRQARPYLQVRAPTEGVVLKRSITRNQWFKAAEEFYTIADIRRVWIYADVYENEARYLRPGMTVLVRHAQLGQTFDARVSEVLPLFDPLSKTLKVRLDVSNPGYDLRPDMFVDVEIPITMPPSLNVSADAVIDSGTRTTLYVETGDGIFEPRAVETGWRLGRRIEITGGIRDGEKVVVSGNFLIDSESRMKTAAANPMVGPEIDLVCGMEVNKDTAERTALTAKVAGMTHYFCSRQCLEAFTKEPQRFAGRTATASGAFRVSRDPVCGMNVHREIAENSGRTVDHAGHTFYFCSQKCLTSFQKEPRKYAEAERPAADHVATAATDHTEARAGKSVRNVRSRKHVGPVQAGARKDDLGASSRSPGVIDWNGQEPEQNDAKAPDWKGWGRFPGAEYLGLKSGTVNTLVPEPDMRGSVGGTAAEGSKENSSPSGTSALGPERADGRMQETAGGPPNP